MKKLLLVALGLVAVLLIAGQVARASTPKQALEAAWYLKGEGDDFLPSNIGIYIAELKCRPTNTQFIICTDKTVPTKGSRLPIQCDEGKFVIRGFTVVGQWGRPHKCKSPPGA